MTARELRISDPVREYFTYDRFRRTGAVAVLGDTKRPSRVVRGDGIIVIHMATHHILRERIALHIDARSDLRLHVHFGLEQYEELLGDIMGRIVNRLGDFDAEAYADYCYVYHWRR